MAVKVFAVKDAQLAQANPIMGVKVFAVMGRAVRAVSPLHGS